MQSVCDGKIIISVYYIESRWVKMHMHNLLHALLVEISWNVLALSSNIVVGPMVSLEEKWKTRNKIKKRTRKFTSFFFWGRGSGGFSYVFVTLAVWHHAHQCSSNYDSGGNFQHRIKHNTPLNRSMCIPCFMVHLVYVKNRPDKCCI